MKTKLFTCGILLCSSLLIASCEKGGSGGDTPSNDNTSTFVDSRVDAYTVVAQYLENGEYIVDEEVDFPSLYEAANYCFDYCDNGSYVKRKGDTTNTILFQRRAGEGGIEGANQDQFFYYKDGNVLNGYSQYLQGNTEFFKDQKVTTIMSSTDNLKQYYQPYHLLAKEGHATTTAAWNILPLLDTSVRYNPIAFSGMRSITFNVDLSEARIRPSYSETQKAVPTITLSSTDSYNYSNQGIYMNTDTGDWYYISGETQSDTKFLEYDTSEIILTSTWNEDTQEYTPNGDVKLTLNYVYNEEYESWSNDLIIEVTYSDGTSKTFNKNYEYSQMNGRGTPRANFALDLISADEDYDETMFNPDFMCGAYFKNIRITEAKGTVPEGLTDETYQGDTPMVGKAGETYSLLNKDFGNLVDVEVILDHYANITYHEDITDGDVYDIDYTPVNATVSRTEEVLKTESLIGAILPTDTATSASVILAQTDYAKLDPMTQKMVRLIDGYTQLEEALDR